MTDLERTDDEKEQLKTHREIMAKALEQTKLGNEKVVVHIVCYFDPDREQFRTQSAINNGYPELFVMEAAFHAVRDLLEEVIPKGRKLL